MDIHDIRRANLAALITTRFSGNQSALATAIDRQASYVSRCLAESGKNQKPIGEKFARHVESCLGLPHGWLDTAHEAAAPSQEAALEPGPTLSRPFKRTKIVGTAQLGPDGYWDALTAMDGWLDVPTNDPEAYALRVKGDSMSPAIRSGWVVWCEPNHELIPGEYVLLHKSNGIHMIKELLYINEEAISLMPPNNTNGRITIQRNEIIEIHHVSGIFPPSRIRNIDQTESKGNF